MWLFCGSQQKSAATHINYVQVCPVIISAEMLQWSSDKMVGVIQFSVEQLVGKRDVFIGCEPYFLFDTSSTPSLLKIHFQQKHMNAETLINVDSQALIRGHWHWKRAVCGQQVIRGISFVFILFYVLWHNAFKIKTWTGQHSVILICLCWKRMHNAGVISICS